MKHRAIQKLETPYAMSLSPSDVDNLDARPLMWTGWQRRHWPANVVRPGTLVYGYDGRPGRRRLVHLLKITHGGGFTYQSKAEFRHAVIRLTGLRPNEKHAHWLRIPIGRGEQSMTGFAVRWKVVKSVDIPHPQPFRQLGWEMLTGSHQLPSARLDCADLYEEGGKVLKTHLAVERNPTLRAHAKLYWHERMAGRIHCLVCKFDFGRKYGARGEDFIEMHHEKPVAGFKRKVRVKRTSLLPLCANCHRMIHRDPAKPLSIDELAKMLRRA